MMKQKMRKLNIHSERLCDYSEELEPYLGNCRGGGRWNTHRI